MKRTTGRPIVACERQLPDRSILNGCGPPLFLGARSSLGSKTQGSADGAAEEVGSAVTPDAASRTSAMMTSDVRARFGYAAGVDEGLASVLGSGTTKARELEDTAG
jgi:hypothetical protein